MTLSFSKTPIPVSDAYNAMVYQTDSNTIAIAKDGSVLKTKPITDIQDDVVIQAALDYLDTLSTSDTGGYPMFIGSGTYRTVNIINVKKPHRVYGAGEDLTSIVCNATVASPVVSVNDSNKNWTGSKFVLSDLTIDGNRTATIGFQFGATSSKRNVFEPSFKNVTFKNCAWYGVFDNSYSGSNYLQCSFLNNGCNNDLTAVPTQLYENRFGYYAGDNQRGVKFVECVFKYNYNGLYLKDARGCSLHGCTIDKNYFHGLYMSNSKANTFVGNSFQENGYYNESLGTENLYSIYITDAASSNNLFDGVYDYNHYVTASLNCLGNYNTFNRYYATTAAKIGTFGGTGTKNLDWVIEGSAANIADGGEITHNLGQTPTWAICTCSVSGESASVTGLSSTKLTVNIKKCTDGSAGTQQTIYWRCGV